MAELRTKLQLRTDTEANWIGTNPLLLHGELAIVETADGLKFKIGNGFDRFNVLPYMYQNDARTIEFAGNTFSLHEFGKYYYKYIDEEIVDDVVVPAHYEKVSGFKAGLQPQVVTDPNNITKYVLAWYEPNASTVEGLNARLTAAEDNITNLQVNKQNTLSAENGIAINDTTNHIGIDLNEIFVLDGGAYAWEEDT